MIIGGLIKMTQNELELLNLIREHNNPEQALITAIEIIVEYLNLHESFELKPSADSRECV